MPRPHRRVLSLPALLFLTLALCLPAGAQTGGSSEVRLPADMTVVPLEGVEPPLTTEPAPVPQTPAPAQNKTEKQAPAKAVEKKAAEAKPEKAEPQAPAGKVPEARTPAAKGKASAAVKPAAKGEKAPTKAEKPVGEVGQIREMTLTVKDGLVLLRLVTDRPVGKVTYLNFKNPRRLAVDVEGRWHSGASVVRAAQGPVKDVRVGEHPDHMRLVLDFRDEQSTGEVNPEIAATPGGLTVAFPAKP